MTHWTDGPIAAFDVETTGVDVEKDRIVSYCIEHRTGSPEGGGITSGLINPGVPIPEGAAQIHGITTERAQAEGMDPRSVLTLLHWGIQNWWKHGAPLVVYNAPFDLTMLDREMRRHLNQPLVIRGPVIDPLVLDKAVDTYRRGSRRLTDVCAHYGVELLEEDAHSAAGDAKAALRLAQRLCKTRVIPPTADPDDPEWMPATPLAQMSLGGLYEYQVEQYRRQRLSFNAYLQRQGKTPDSDNLVWPMAPYNGEV